MGREGRLAGLTLCLVVAAQAVPAHAGCEASEDQLPKTEIDDFIRDPRRLFMLYGDKKEELASRIGALARSRKVALDALKSILPTAKLTQRSAMGQGAFTAVAICQISDHYKASQIEAWAKSLTDPEFISAYRRARYLAEVRAEPPPAAAPRKRHGNGEGADALPLDGPLDTKSLDLSDSSRTPGY